MKSQQTDYKRQIEICFWLFVFLLMTEGIFRRWLLPQYSNVFLIIRDPIVIYVFILGVKYRCIKYTTPKLFVLFSVISLILTLVVGHGNLLVALYGVRINFMYFPFIFICSQVLKRESIIKLGAILTVLLLPMVFLSVIQFFSPQSALVNIGVAGDEDGAGFSGAMGYFRPPGIFTFIAGLTDYYALTFPFLLFFLLNKNVAKEYKLSKLYLWLTVIAYIISLFVSISRTHLVTSLLVIAMSVIIFFRGKYGIVRLFLFSLVIAVIFSVLLLNEDFQLFFDVMVSRFETANEVENGLTESAFTRTFGWLARAIDKVGICGFGEGHFSNFGMQILYGDANNYTGAIKVVEDATEMEWGRLVCEDGIVLGLLFIFLRVKISIGIFVKAWKRLRVNNDQLLWFLMPMACVSIAIYQLKAAYNLGFMVLEAISCLVLIKKPIKKQI